MDIVKLTAAFLQAHFARSGAEPGEIGYRYDHTLRVAHVGIDLAGKENADLKAVVLGCLLHDVGKFEPGADVDHGRASARIARKFLDDLDARLAASGAERIGEARIRNVCFGIASHVDGIAGEAFDHPDTPEARIVSDADNIDRFAAYRIHEMMKHALEEAGPPAERRLAVAGRVARLRELRDTFAMGTRSGGERMKANLELAIRFFESYLHQLETTALPEILL